MAVKHSDFELHLEAITGYDTINSMANESLVIPLRFGMVSWQDTVADDLRCTFTDSHQLAMINPD